MTISNQYKDTLDDLIHGLNAEFKGWLRPINKRSCNASKSESNLMGLLERDCLDKNVSNSYLGWY